MENKQFQVELTPCLKMFFTTGRFNNYKSKFPSFLTENIFHDMIELFTRVLGALHEVAELISQDLGFINFLTSRRASS